MNKAELAQHLMDARPLWLAIEDELTRALIREAIKVLAGHETADWISLLDRKPYAGQPIEGSSDTGSWLELWNPSEPIGKMTHWRPL